MANLQPQLLSKHLSNCKRSCSSQNLTLSGVGACVCSDILVYKCLIYREANNQQLQDDLSSVFEGYTLFLKHSNCQTDFEHYLTHTTERTASSKWLGSMLGGTKSPSLQQKPFLVVSKTPTCGWWDSTVLRLQLTPPTAMERVS